MWHSLGTTMASSFLASLVESVEALTVILAVGSTRGWRPTLIGGVAALVVLVVIVALFGGALARSSVKCATACDGRIANFVWAALASKSRASCRRTHPASR